MLSSGSSESESACDTRGWASLELLQYEWALHLRSLFRWLNDQRPRALGRLGRREIVGEEEK